MFTEDKGEMKIENNYVERVKCSYKEINVFYYLYR